MAKYQKKRARKKWEKEPKSYDQSVIIADFVSFDGDGKPVLRSNEKKDRKYNAAIIVYAALFQKNILRKIAKYYRVIGRDVDGGIDVCFLVDRDDLAMYRDFIDEVLVKNGYTTSECPIFRPRTFNYGKLAHHPISDYVPDWRECVHTGCVSFSRWMWHMVPEEWGIEYYYFSVFTQGVWPSEYHHYNPHDKISSGIVSIKDAIIHLETNKAEKIWSNKEYREKIREAIGM